MCVNVLVCVSMYCMYTCGLHTYTHAHIQIRAQTYIKYSQSIIISYYSFIIFRLNKVIYFL